MFFQSKRKRIEKYLESKSSATSAFDELLKDYLNDILKQNLTNLGISKTEIYIDWLDNYKCIIIQGKYGDYFIDIQVEENEFSIAYDRDETDDPQGYALVTKENFYSILVNTLKKLA